MSWRLVRLACRCWFCPTPIEAGDLARYGDKTPAVWCVACAAKSLNDHPPAEFLAPAEAEPAPAVEAPAAQPTLFGVDEMTGRFKHADARVALDRARASLSKVRA